ncbi:HdeD family acid-resistance protein [Acidithiobacillus sp.]
MNELPSISTIVDAELKSFGRYSVFIAILLILIGIGGLIAPVILSVLTTGFIAGILIISGVVWLVHSYKLHQHHLADWIKPLMLLTAGTVMVALPAAGIASIALLFIFYFILDAYRNFTQSRVYSAHGRGWFIFSGIIDIFIAILFIVTWPQGSLILVGIVVGVNLIFDGIILLVVRSSMRSSSK